MRTKIKKGDIAQCKLSMYDKEGQKLLFLGHWNSGVAE